MSLLNIVLNPFQYKAQNIKQLASNFAILMFSDLSIVANLEI